jgi:hypothetical protein
VPDVFREVSHQGWGSRIGSSFGGVIFGLLAFVVSFPLLFWNEGRAVRTAQSLEEGAGAVVSATADKLDPAHEGKLVHLTGQATTDQVLSDSQFGVSVNAIKLIRQAQMYQWKEDEKTERKKKLGGGEERVTTYTYQKTWADHAIKSSEFKHPEDHTNPPQMPFDSHTQVASTVTLGPYTLSSSLVGQIGNAESLPVTEQNLGDAASELKDKAKLSGGQYYLGQDPANPQVGDAKIGFSVVKPTVVSFVSKQVGNSFQPYQAQAGDEIDKLMVGSHSAEAIFKQLEFENTLLTWGLRIGGVVIMTVGLGLIFSPLGVLADVIPFLGDLMRLGTGLFAVLIALPLSLITISIAWIVYRPLLGIALLVVAVGLIAGMKMLANRRKTAMPATN